MSSLAILRSLSALSLLGALACGASSSSSHQGGAPTSAGAGGLLGAAGSAGVGSAGSSGATSTGGASWITGNAGTSAAAGTGGATSAGAGSGGGGAGGTIAAGAPIQATAGQWTWVDVPGSQCADGSPTGFGANLSATSSDAVIFLEGGGACWDGASCWGPVQTAFYVATGYGQLAFSTDPQVASYYLLNRNDGSNPFQDKNLFFIPYCTGDAFGGDNVTTLSYLGIDHTTYFKGYSNVGRFLPRILGTVPGASRVWVVGSSAGGFGAAFNFGRIQDAFPAARVDVIDDSGQPIAPDPARWQAWLSAWNLQLPAGCPACATSPSAFVDYYRARYPKSHFGLLSYEYDLVIAPFMNLSELQFQSELYTLLDHLDSTWPQARYFVESGTSHVTLLTPPQALKDWLTAMVSDSPSWMSTRP